MPKPFDKYPLPWTVDPVRPSTLHAANGKIVARFVAAENVTDSFDFPNAIADSQMHCAMVADLVYNADKLANNVHDLRAIQSNVVEWADKTFPDRKPWWAFLKLFEEVGEVIKSPHDATEWADVFIMLVDLANMHGVTDIGTAIRDKMELNRKRTWKQTEIGTMEHNNGEAK